MGLIKTGLKAAVAVKTAHYVHDRIERRQQAQWAAQDQQSATGPPATSPANPGATARQDRTAVLRQLKDLGELKAAGVLTEEEFAQQKALILGG
jgi:hypothetical protein